MAPLLRSDRCCGEQIDDRVRRVALELGRVGAREPCDVPRELHHRELHAEADPEEGDLVLAGVADRRDLPFRSSVAEPARDEHRVEVRKELLGPVLLDGLRIDVLEVNLAVVREARVHERFMERLVRVAQVDILADDADLDGAPAGFLNLSHTRCHAERSG